MASDQRKKFKTTQEWHDFVALKGRSISGKELLQIRSDCYREIEAHRKRPLIVYATKFLDNLPQGIPNYIDLSDIDGFTDLINAIKGKNLDVLLHSPGGRPDATERIVSILRRRFSDICFLVPHSAYSAATMLAVSGDKIILHPSATLGPIDPQINGIPARSIKRGVENIKEKIKKEGPETLPAYIPLIEKYSIELLEMCDDSEKLAKKLVEEWLKDYMFKDEKKVNQKIKNIVNYLSDYDAHLLHARPLKVGELQRLGIKVEIADGKLTELLWEAMILLNGFFNMSKFVKLFETSHGISWGKQFQQVMIPIQPLEKTKTP